MPTPNRPSGHINMAMTLDGFVARDDHSLDWLMKQPNAEDPSFAEFSARMDVIVMGSGSLRTVMGFEPWPYELPVIVLSRSMTTDDLPEALREKVEIRTDSPQDLMAVLHERGVRRVYVDGGAVIQSFLAEGLIDEFNVAIVPILIGSGIRIFGDINADIDLKQKSVQRYDNGIVRLTYTTAEGTGG
ncbi:dihydrofolate reductase family protein [Actibacterium sp. 188UL27-1]|uniref:dihydrofolate reductase family protein n=1 Tax=Actibacterium sp. 188UL27-1 TaxID=2786961 RepID=UPI00195647C1|nr:dihydrofolate reductase family protein [Actibacterium sp. 188UL27-1]MBM7067536.1 dihydrofolate reductase family protein [Actibacterium sp. 188UL27-1]